MALVRENEDGTYGRCALCGQPMVIPFYATSHFLGDPSHPLFAFSDAAMHWDCYARWPAQDEFAGLFFAAMDYSNEWWPVVYRSDLVLVKYGVYVDEAAVVLRRPGSQIRVPGREWQRWLAGDWPRTCEHELERRAVEEVLPELAGVQLPPRRELPVSED